MVRRQIAENLPILTHRPNDRTQLDAENRRFYAIFGAPLAGLKFGGFLPRPMAITGEQHRTCEFARNRNSYPAGVSPPSPRAMIPLMRR